MAGINFKVFLILVNLILKKFRKCDPGQLNIPLNKISKLGKVKHFHLFTEYLKFFVHSVDKNISLF